MLKNGVADVLFGTNAVNGNFNTLPTVSVSGKNSSGMSFAETFNSTNDKSVDTKVENNTTQNHGTTVVENKPVKEVKENADVKQQQKENVTDDDKVATVEEIADGSKKIVEEIKKTFDVTDEEIEEAMATLMISFEDLFNTKDLQNLLMAVTNTTDSVELLTNVELYDGMNEIVDFMNEVKGEIISDINITEDAFTDIINDKSMINDVITNIPKAETNENVDNKAEAYTVSEDAPLADNKAIANAEVISTKQTDNVKADNNGEDNKVKVEVNVEKTENVDTEEAVRKIVTDNSKNQFGSNDSNENKQSNKNPENEFGLLNEIVKAPATTVADIVETVESYSNAVDTENIMRQISDYIKVNITANSTSMEMQLHPASLGTVNMQVVSQNGQVTAQFTVQNEAVKAVLENQLLSLQETLNEAGTKVSAIEVTVANYNLDSELYNNNGDNSSNNSQKGSKRRNINLNGLEALDDLDSDEMVEIDMMKANGNSVSFRA